MNLRSIFEFYTDQNLTDHTNLCEQWIDIIVVFHVLRKGTDWRAIDHLPTWLKWCLSAAVIYI